MLRHSPPCTLNPFCYRGYIYDDETGLYYCNSRYYDPAVGRFINSDTVAVVTLSPDVPHWDRNLYAYCDNNPVMRMDNGGQFWWAVKAAVGGVKSFATSLITGGSLGDAIVDGIGGAVEGAFSNMFSFGKVLTGVVSGTISYVTSRVKGESVASSLKNAVISGVSSALPSITKVTDMLDGVVSKQTKLLDDTSVDLTLGFGEDLMFSAMQTGIENSIERGKSRQSTTVSSLPAIPVPSIPSLSSEAFYGGVEGNRGYSRYNVRI